MANYKLNKGKYGDQPESEKDVYYGDGWSVRKKGTTYFLKFISGSLQGGIKEIEIKEADYMKARNGELSFDELCTKYDIS